MAAPQLVVNQQDSLAKLLLTTKTGVPRDVHVVVKNTPFNIVLGIANNFPRNRPERIDLSKSTIQVDVHYDSDDPREGKQVKLMTSKPCEYKVHLSDKRFDEATLEVRMKVLTSQHEDMLFRLHISLSTENSPHVLRSTTAAIKVVSKPDQVRRINGEKGKKRTHADIVNESLDRIEKRQQQQQAMLLRILKNNPQAGSERLSSSPLEEAPSPAPMPSSLQHLQHLRAQPTPSNPTVAIPVPVPALETKSEDLSFEAAFSLCMKKYAALPQSERPAKMRKIVSTSSSRDARSISEFSDALRVEGLGGFSEVKQVPHPVSIPVAPVPAPIAPVPAPVSAPAPVPALLAPTPLPYPASQTLPAETAVKCEPADNFSTEFSSISSSLSFSDPALTSDFVHEMFQSTLSPFHF